MHYRRDGLRLHCHSGQRAERFCYAERICLDFVRDEVRRNRVLLGWQRLRAEGLGGIDS